MTREDIITQMQSNRVIDDIIDHDIPRDYENEMYQLQEETGRSNFQEEPASKKYRDGVTTHLSDAQFGKQAKQAMRDSQVAGAVASQKDAQIADMNNQMARLLSVASKYKQDRDGLASAMFNV